MTEAAISTSLEQAAAVHIRRVERALKELQYEIEIIGRKVRSGTADADEARKAAELVTTIASRLGSLEALRDVQAETTGEQS